MLPESKSFIYNFTDKIPSKYLNKKTLGTKGYNLFAMSKIGLRVPHGFTISSEVCRYFLEQDAKYPTGFFEELDENIKKLESQTNKKFGYNDNPLLVSVRSGAEISMPGMMDTILNIGLNDEIVEIFANKTSPEFAYDCYLRLIHMFSEIVLGLDYYILEDVKQKFFETNINLNLNREKIRQENHSKKNSNIQYSLQEYLSQLTHNQIKNLLSEFHNTLAEKGQIFPQNVYEQLKMAVTAVMNSWNCNRAKIYRQINGISGNSGTAVTVQSMVFGNISNSSATGVLFTRNPINGERKIFGEYILKAQGEDVVSGKFTPSAISGDSSSLEKIMPKIYNDLVESCNLLERHNKDMQDVEFTIENGKLFILQTRNGKRSSKATIKIIHDFVQEGLITKQEAFKKIDKTNIEKLLHPTIINSETLNKIGNGLASSPGAAVGKAVFTTDDAEKYSKNFKVILLRNETSPDDIEGMSIAEGIITSKGGLTSHAAVVARGMGKPCITGADILKINEKKKKAYYNDNVINHLDDISINGTTGEIYLGIANLEKPPFPKELQNMLSWAEGISSLNVRANAESVEDIKNAIKFGCDGIGLCRSEHMFFEKTRLNLFRRMILCKDKKQTQDILENTKILHSKDFENIFALLEGKKVCIRLLDPPLHEFLPKNDDDIAHLANNLNIPEEKIQDQLKKMHETNPMLGHRGARLGITSPEIYAMQVEAIFEAAIKTYKKTTIKPKPEIMLPLISNLEELLLLKKLIINTAEKIMADYGQMIPYKIGTMIELPRAIMIADQLAYNVDFISFGTNDLTQTIYGISRDDISSFMPSYIAKGIIKKDPFITIDKEGVGMMIKLAIDKARKANPKITIGICGEHGGDPESIQFFKEIGVDYVSCSALRIPGAKFASV